MDKDYIWPRITKDTPMPELKRIHQMMWDYAIKYGEKPKTPYFSNCAACEYNVIHRGLDERPCDCPIIWPNDKNEPLACTGMMGLYSKWYDAEGEEKIALAKQIRDLPWKFEVEE